MKCYCDMTAAERHEEYDQLLISYNQLKERGLSLNMARGKPSPEQLDLSMPMLNVLNNDSQCISDGVDCRNYGELDGIAEAKRLFGEYMGVAEAEIIVTGSSSLTFMYDCLSRAMLTGVLGSDQPWSKSEKVKFLCPVPGYDRHFSMCEFLGIEMISVPMDDQGPDMDMVEQLVQTDGTIKGMWCVPKYSNPTGITYADETIRRLARLQPKAKDFRIFCDNAYAMHTVYKENHCQNLLDACKEAGNPNMVYLFGSTNKITFPGSGVAFFAASEENVAFTKKQLSNQAISWDKMNMLRHVRYFKDLTGIKKQMNAHGDLLRPKFDIVLNALRTQLEPLAVGSFDQPDGGYFVTYRSMPGCAGQIVKLCREAGMILTAAGATHPYGCDPEDSFIRIAPSFPSEDELKAGMHLFCICAKIAALEKLS